MQLKIKRLLPTATLPSYQSEYASGMDLCAAEDYLIWPGERRSISTGIAIEIPFGHEAQIRSRSGLAIQRGVAVMNSPGTIDYDYRGEIRVILRNDSSESYGVLIGARIAQLVIAPVSRVDIVDVDELTATGRGESGLGSTGE